MFTNIILAIALGILGALAVLVPHEPYLVISRGLVVVSIVVLVVLIVVREWRKGTHGRSASRQGISTEPLAFVAHQLRSPLSVIKGYADLILHGNYEESSEEIAQAASKIKINADRALKTIDSLLDFHLLQAGRMTHHPERVGLNDFIEERVKEHGKAVSEKNLSLVFKPDSKKPKVIVDPMHLHYIFDNLLDNALKYTKEGAIEVRVTAGAKEHEATVIVSDTGQGIPAELLESIFLPFERDSRLAHDVKGVGLGLAIAKRLVEINGGKVWAESDGVGRGATFYVKIPIQAP